MIAAQAGCRDAGASQIDPLQRASVSGRTKVFIQVNPTVSAPSFVRQQFAYDGTLFILFVCLAELITAMLTSVVSGTIWHMANYGDHGEIETFAAVGLLAGLGYVLPFLLRNEYTFGRVLENRRNFGTILLTWTAAFVSLAVIGFLTKTTGTFSRGWLLGFYAVGLLSLWLLNMALAALARRLLAGGYVAKRKLMLVGGLSDVQRLKGEIDTGDAHANVVAAAVMPPLSEATKDEVSRRLVTAALKARALAVDDIVIAADWSNPSFIDAAVAQFRELPAAVHLSVSPIVGQLREAKVSRFGSAAALSVSSEPLDPVETMVKRTLDIVLASIALVLLAPLLGLVALMIKLDSKGPVFFRQRRRGYNLEEFRIWKFRTMHVAEDGSTVVQAQKDDQRVTRLGAYLRRWSIDELPQLINVVRGEMSLVGPRPHAIAHDEFFEKRIAQYPRRLNVKPGITGWAQVNGLRGATQTDDIMAKRVGHDLHYIENWSLMFDLYIMLLTVVSRRARSNAY